MSFVVPSFLETTLEVPVDVEVLPDVPLFMETTLVVPVEVEVLSDEPLLIVVPVTDDEPL